MSSSFDSISTDSVPRVNVVAEAANILLALQFVPINCSLHRDFDTESDVTVEEDDRNFFLSLLTEEEEEKKEDDYEMDDEELMAVMEEYEAGMLEHQVGLYEDLRDEAGNEIEGFFEGLYGSGTLYSPIDIDRMITDEIYGTGTNDNPIQFLDDSTSTTDLTSGTDSDVPSVGLLTQAGEI